MLLGYGGDRIKRKLFLSVLLLFGLALILNVSTSAAANTTVGTNIVTDHTAPKVISTTPANKTIVKSATNVKVKFSETIKAGNNLIYLKNGITTISTTKTISGNTLTLTPKSALASGVKYTLTLNAGSVTDLSGNGNPSYTSSFTVSPINLTQMKDGISRAEKFYANNGRLPNTVSYGSTLIPIAQFQKIIATQGLTIKKPTVVSSTASLASIMKAASKYRYSGAAHTAEGMMAIGSGDCWAMSDYLYKNMTKAGMKARIIQYATAYSSRHRSVQYYSNGSWHDAPYRTYFSTQMFNNTQSYGTVIACNM
jgi:methionine-rich copper-binding protein CopC